MTQTNGHVDPTAWAELQALAHINGQDQMRLLLQTIGRFVGAQIKPLRDEIAALKAKVAQLEEGGIKFAGTHQRALGYGRGTLVAYDGSLWAAIADTQPLQVPGAHAVWQLAVRGQRVEAPRSPTKHGSLRPPA